MDGARTRLSLPLKAYAPEAGHDMGGYEVVRVKSPRESCRQEEECTPCGPLFLA